MQPLICKFFFWYFLREHEGFLIHLINLVPEKFFNDSIKYNLLELAIEHKFEQLAMFLTKFDYKHFENIIEKDKGSYGHIALSNKFLFISFYTLLMKYLVNVDITNWRGFTMLHLALNHFKPHEFRNLISIVELLLVNR